MGRNRSAEPEHSFEITIKPHSYRVFRIIDTNQGVSK